MTDRVMSGPIRVPHPSTDRTVFQKIMEGHELFLKLSLDDLREMLQHMEDTSENENIRNRTFDLETDDMIDDTHIVIKCFYTLLTITRLHSKNRKYHIFRSGLIFLVYFQQNKKRRKPRKGKVSH